jgi:hypothetical protein
VNERKNSSVTGKTKTRNQNPLEQLELSAQAVSLGHFQVVAATEFQSVQQILVL